VSDDAMVRELRKLFPVVEHWTYLYNGSIHPCPRPVADAMRSFLHQWECDGREAWPPVWQAFCRLREKFAKLIHADARNIVITESTTAGINLAAQILRPQPGQNVVVTDLDFMTNTYTWLVSHPEVELRFVPGKAGKIFVEDLATRVDGNTAAASICAVTVGSGYRCNLAEVYEVTARHNVPLMVDASQALGVIDVNVRNPAIDFLASTASKWLMGPTGVGFLYLADRWLNAVPPAAGWLSAANRNDWDLHHCRLHEDATRFQGGMLNLVGVVGALAALELIEQIGRDFIERRVRELTTYAMEELQALDVEIWTPRADDERAGIVFFRVPQSQELYAKLKAERICCGNFLGGIRFDPNFYNTHEEIDRLVSVVRSHTRH
jgi:cysteine desulfurase/selenocysteine lyase